MGDTDDFQLPTLRQDISLHEGPTSPDGSPTWSLYDPVRNQYFRIGWVEFECLSRWQSSANALIAQIHQHTTLTVNHFQIQNLMTFLVSSNLVIADTKHLFTLQQSIKKQARLSMFQSYLFLKLRLIRPDRFLQKTLPWVEVFFTRWFALIVLLTGIIGLYLVSRQWDTFTNTFNYFFNTQGMLYFFIALFFVKVLHEFGHAYTATRYGCRVTSMGVAIMVFYPVFYTDTTDAWRLTCRKKRARIAAAGIAVELMIAVFTTFAWSFFDAGPLRNTLFFISTSSWLFSLLINANPLLKFDGYYFLSDWLNISNLQSRSSSLAICQLRRSVFGLNEASPFTFSPRKRFWLIVYAFAMWTYRVVIFFSIAAIIYYLFFKLLGILLMLGCALMFIILPISKELIYVWSQRAKMQWNKQTRTAATCFSICLLLLVIPWKSSIVAPALLEYAQHTRAYSSEAAQIKSLNIQNDQSVVAGQLLMTLHSPELEHQIEQATYDIQLLEARLRSELGRTEKLGYRQADRAELASKMTNLQALVERKNKLRITAPFSGNITSLDTNLKVNRWIEEKTFLFELINLRQNIITAYVSEKDFQNIQTDKTARFYPDVFHTSDTIAAKVISIDQMASERLDAPYLASTYGGDIAVHPDNQKKLLIKEAVYRVTAEPIKTTQPLKYVTRGKLQLAGEGKSMIQRLWVAITAVIIRESGF